MSRDGEIERFQQGFEGNRAQDAAETATRGIAQSLSPIARGGEIIKVKVVGGTATRVNSRVTNGCVVVGQRLISGSGDGTVYTTTALEGRPFFDLNVTGTATWEVSLLVF